MFARVSLLVSFALLACGDAPDLTVHAATGVSSVLRVDRIYKSMAGPTAEVKDLQVQPGPQELLWLTAYRTKVAAEDGGPISQEFMCHNSLDMNTELHAKLFGWKRRLQSGRTFTTSQGQFDVVLPEGYGIPVLSNEPLFVQVQVLNHNAPDVDLGVRQQIEIEYVKDEEARGRLKPVFPANASVMALVEGDGGVWGQDHPTSLQAGASCLPGNLAPQASQGSLLTDHPGRVFTGHWVVPPGREVRRTLVNRSLGLPFDTTVHFIGTHLHPFAETLELRDLTTNETVYTSRAHGPEEGIGLADVGAFSSVEGLRLFKDHDYEMVSVYNNTSGVDQDAMATFFFYLHDKDAAAGLEAIREALASGETVGGLPRGGGSS